MNDCIRDLELVLLGAVLASRSAADRVFTELDRLTLEHRDVHKILVGLKAGDTTALHAWLTRHGAKAQPGDRAIDAVTDAVKLAGKERKKRQLASELMDASKLLNHEQYMAYLRERLNKEQP
jgi:hypothetical protein